jgi:hypothetical protein
LVSTLCAVWDDPGDLLSFSDIFGIPIAFTSQGNDGDKPKLVSERQYGCIADTENGPLPGLFCYQDEKAGTVNLQRSNSLTFILVLGEHTFVVPGNPSVNHPCQNLAMPKADHAQG